MITNNIFYSMEQVAITINEVEVVFYKYDSAAAKRVRSLYNKNQKIYDFKNNRKFDINPYIEPTYNDLRSEALALKSDEVFGASCKKLGFNSRCIEFSKQWDIESKSTYYWIRYICKSLICTGELKPRLTILEWHEEWKKCKKFIKFFNRVGQDRVILGAGPSGCGKTTIAKKMFPALGINDVVSIDGGYSREMSMVWNITTAFAPNGISDIYDLFKQNSSKDELFEFITTRNKTNDNGYCGIYIPDTLVNLKTSLTLSPAINKYIQYDPKHWIGLLIWQHLNNSEKQCFFTGKQTCKGCDISGENRQIIEGKKYSSRNYDTSMIASVRALSRAPYKFIIHNSGSTGGVDTMLYDMSNQGEKPEYGFVPPEIDLKKIPNVVYEEFKMERPDLNVIIDKFKLLNNRRPEQSRPPRFTAALTYPTQSSTPPPSYDSRPDPGPRLPTSTTSASSVPPPIPPRIAQPSSPVGDPSWVTDSHTTKETIEYIESVAKDLLRVTAELSRRIPAGGKRTRRRRTKHKKNN